MPGLRPAAREYGQPQQENDFPKLRRRKQRVMALIAEGFPARDSRLFDLLEQLEEAAIPLRRVTAGIAAEPRLESHLLNFCARLRVPGQGPVYGHDREQGCGRGPAPLRLSEAAVLLGREQLRVLLMGWAFTRFAAAHLPSGALAALLRHGLGTAARGQEIALRARPGLAGQACLGGLVHDIGRLPLLLAAQEAIGSAEGPAFALAGNAAERTFFGVDHCQAGRWMALAGRFPAWLTEIIEHHHDPAQAVDHRPLVALVAAAERTAQPFASAAGERAAARRHEASPGPPVRAAGAEDLRALLRRRPAGLAETDRAARSGFLRAAPAWSGRSLFGAC